jgi:membrane protease YdiL (CAAX protease family)
MFTAPFLIIPLRTGKKRAELISFKKPEKKFFAPLVLFGVGMSAFANIATSAVSSFFAGFGIEFLSPKFDYPTGFFGILISVLAIAVTPALVEEFSMRGMVMGHLRQQGDGFAIVISAILFAMIHGNFVQIPFAFIMGLIIGYVVVKSGSIITGIAVHFINNFASLVLDIVSDNIDSVMLKSAITVIYLAACILCGFIGLRLAKKHGEHVWELDKPDTVLSNGEKLGYFITAPAMIVAMGAFVAEALQMVQIS